MPTPTYNALQHLIIAQRVCDYVGQKMTKGSPLKPIDMAHSDMRYQSQMMYFLINLASLPSHLDPDPPMGLPLVDLSHELLVQQRRVQRCLNRLTQSAADPISRIKAEALVAEQFGMGNCSEQACVGFRYLCNCTKCGVFTKVDVGIDHVFLVLGAGKDDVNGDYRFNQAPNWPENAVICDPSYHEWFIVKKDWSLKMRLILAATERRQPVQRRSLIRGVISLRNAVQGPGPV